MAERRHSEGLTMYSEGLTMYSEGLTMYSELVYETFSSNRFVTPPLLTLDQSASSQRHSRPIESASARSLTNRLPSSNEEAKR
eukprot:7352817-Pyramimonas_sp.AAC.1